MLRLHYRNKFIPLCKVSTRKRFKILNETFIPQSRGMHKFKARTPYWISMEIIKFNGSICNKIAYKPKKKNAKEGKKQNRV